MSTLAERVRALLPARVHSFMAGSLPSGATLARASTGWRTNSSGVIVPESTDVARFNYNASGALEGLLVEPQSTNSLLRSEALDHAAWATESRTTVTANAVAAPDGATTADKLLETTDNEYHIIYSAAVTVVSGTPFGASTFVKAAENSLLTLSVFGNSGTKWIAATTNLATGAVTKTGAGAGGTLSSSGIQSFAGGWYRPWLIGSITDTSAYLQVELINTADPTYQAFGVTAGYAGNASNGLYPWGAQLETGGIVSSYAPTAASTVTRSADVLSLAIPTGTYSIEITRLSGLTRLTGVSVTGDSYTVPTDVSPLQLVAARRTA